MNHCAQVGIKRSKENVFSSHSYLLINQEGAYKLFKGSFRVINQFTPKSYKKPETRYMLFEFIFLELFCTLLFFLMLPVTLYMFFDVLPFAGGNTLL